jgi:hypothetical protein
MACASSGVQSPSTKRSRSDSVITASALGSMKTAAYPLTTPETSRSITRVVRRRLLRSTEKRALGRE